MHDNNKFRFCFFFNNKSYFVHYAVFFYSSFFRFSSFGFNILCINVFVYYDVQFVFFFLECVNLFKILDDKLNKMFHDPVN